MKINIAWFLRDFTNTSFVVLTPAYSPWLFQGAFFLLCARFSHCWEPGRAGGSGCGTPKERGPRAARPRPCRPPASRPGQAAQPHRRGRAFLPVIQSRTEHQMSDLLTLLAALSGLSCKLLWRFIFLSFPSLQLLVIIIIRHKWPLSHSARRVLPWMRPNYRERARVRFRECHATQLIRKGNIMNPSHFAGEGIFPYAWTKSVCQTCAKEKESGPRSFLRGRKLVKAQQFQKSNSGKGLRSRFNSHYFSAAVSATA